MRQSQIQRFFLAALCVVAATAVSASAEIMPVSEIKPGMKGYGTTVFEGNRVERFDVEIIGVLRNTGPGQNLILANVDSPVVRRAGIIAGMSGSPVYIDGKIIGALAFGWQFAKEPVAGITPIDEMLKMSSRTGASRPSGAIPASIGTMNATQFLTAMSSGKTGELFDKLVADWTTGRTPASVSGAKPVAVPLSMSSFAPETIARFAGPLTNMNFVAVPAGAASTSTSVAPADKNFKFAAGDPIGAVLMNGDFNVAASGTVTHVDGDKVYAFGHPFLDLGEISFPMTRSEVVGVLPSLASSFKFANTLEVVGALRQDRAVGIMGVMGEKARMIPVSLSLEGSGLAETYNVNVVRHSQLAPLILAMAADTVVANAQRAAGERTVMLDSEIQIKGFEPIRLREGWAGPQARSAIPAYLAVVAGYLMANEFRDAEVESVKVHLRHDDQLRTARVVEASLETPERGRISPGDTVKIRAVLKPYRGETFVETFDVQIPDDQPAGNAYLLVGSGTLANSIDFSLVPPDPRTLEQVVGVLHRLRPSTDLTVGLYSSSDGAVTAGVYLPNLPPTMRAVVSSDTSNGAQAPVRFHPSGQKARSLAYIVEGMVKIDLDVQPQV